LEATFPKVDIKSLPTTVNGGDIRNRDERPRIKTVFDRVTPACLSVDDGKS